MSINDIIRAWTDASFRKSLEAQGIKVPANPAGESALDNDGLLTDEELDAAVGGARTSKAASGKKTRPKSRRRPTLCCPRW